MKVNRVEQTVIKKSHPMYKTINDFSIRSNNFYNFAMYHIRQEFINNGNYIDYYTMQTNMKSEEPYKHLMSQSSQCILRLIDSDWKSYFKSIKAWKRDPSKFLGMPRLPNYKKSGKKFIWFLKNNQTYIKDGKLYFLLKAMKGYGFKTEVTNRLISVRFIPRHDVFVMEIVYEVEVEKKTAYNDNIVSIDLGVNNLVAMSNSIGLSPVIIKGKIVKSINQYYNKERARVQSELPEGVYWSNKLDVMTRRRFNRVKNYMHHTSRYIIDYCLENNIDTIVVGKNDLWKQNINIGRVNNQKFVCIPYEMLIRQLEAKGELNGIKIIQTEENYTSGTSFIDNEYPIEENYNIKRRSPRGLFKTNNGTVINSDINASYQIGKKVFPDAFNGYGIEGCLNPIIINNVIKRCSLSH